MLKKREKQSNIVNRRDKNPDGSQLISYVMMVAGYNNEKMV